MFWMFRMFSLRHFSLRLMAAHYFRHIEIEKKHQIVVSRLRNHIPEVHCLKKQPFPPSFSLSLSIRKHFDLSWWNRFANFTPIVHSFEWSREKCFKKLKFSQLSYKLLNRKPNTSADNHFCCSTKNKSP